MNLKSEFAETAIEELCTGRQGKTPGMRRKAGLKVPHLVAALRGLGENIVNISEGLWAAWWKNL